MGTKTTTQTYQNLDISLLLVTLATVSATVIQAQAYLGHPLNLWTGLSWLLALTVLVVPMLLDFKMDHRIVLMRYAALACMLLALKCVEAAGPSVSLAMTVVLTWRWVDIALMWLNWHSCKTPANDGVSRATV